MTLFSSKPIFTSKQNDEIKKSKAKVVLVKANGMNPLELTALLARTALNDQNAFERLYGLTAAKLNAIAYRIVHNHETAHEVLQEAFIQIWHNAANYRSDKAEPFTWMAAIVRYRSYDRIRSEQRHHDNQQIIDEIDNIEQVSPSTQKSISVCEIGQELEDCLNQLEDSHRRGILMAYYYGYSRDDIAAKLATPLNTVKSWLRRGLVRLQQCLEQ